MSKFGLDENDVKKIVDTRVQNKYGNTLAMVENNRQMIDQAGAVDPRVPILNSRIKTLEKNMDDMRSDIALLIEHINTLS